jgi:hypothetical protein
VIYWLYNKEQLDSKIINTLDEEGGIVINILYEDENSIFDYYRNTFLISNKILVVSEKPKNINFEIENHLNGYEHILFVSEYDNFYNIVDNILKNYNENKINEIKEKQYNWFKSVYDMDNYKNFILKKFWFNYVN